ncbi:LacI family transcriptional regulator [Labrys miyagiensis]|uniref:LacI family transcriptional regulator n=1 Tax=Labrys miyagiensis TaxID=346912 RepID=A0ABQ6CM95_9HYPH|nr:substrate-binding domain-containing protein [Labrys miyagiensis]GLS21418.1 LacI family transcriptional regulator [Labrys miyagiensis]
MEKVVRLVDIAKAAGVSQGTASNVFNRPHLVRDEVRERVRDVARSLGYRGPDPKGRLLRAGKVNAIGLVTAEPLSYFFEDPYARAMMAAISQACDAHSAGIALVSAMNEQRLAWNVQSALVDGFILFCIDEGPRLVELTRERQLPFVALHLGTKDETISAIGVDNFAGARLAARHLAGLGHRKFAILATPLTDEHYGFVTLADVQAGIYSTSRDRVAGYFDVLAGFGVDTAGIPVLETQSEHEEALREGLGQIFAAADPPTALLCMSDRIAFAAITWLAERGLSVPGDVSVIGFDGVAEGAQFRPPLTTIAQPIHDMGQLAVEMILGDSGDIQRREFETELVVRESTAAAKK